MKFVREIELVAQALVSRAVPSPVAPLSSREFWEVARIAPLDALAGRNATQLSADLGLASKVAERVPELLGRARALALATEELEHKGFWVLTGISDKYPQRLRDRLGDNAPALLNGVGNAALIHEDGLGVVGSRDIPLESIDVARRLARAATDHGIPVVSGAARGVDQHAMNAAFEFGGTVVGVLADSLARAASSPATRRGIASEQICLITPYSPHAPFSAGNAMGRNKIIYALSRSVVVVRSDEGSGGTWAGATEALSKEYSTVYTWLGAGAAHGNEALLREGAHELRAGDDLITVLNGPTVEGNAKSHDSVSVALF
jgi:predicted Rossmann fold nucleotide-binding protein DprA/Smf involved in DNA uptake